MSKDIGKQIAALRKEKGWRQSDLGREAGGIDKRTVQSIELGRRGGGWKTIVALLDALGCDVQVRRRAQRPADQSQ